LKKSHLLIFAMVPLSVWQKEEAGGRKTKWR